MAQGMRVRGVELDDTGTAIDGTNNVELYSVDQTTTAVATTSTDSSGLWAFDHATQGRFDVKIINGSDVVWIRGRDEFQVTTIQARNPTTANAALHALSTTSEAQSLVATFGFRPSTESSGVETADEPSDGDRGYIDFELSNDNATPQQWIAGRIEWEGVDVSDGSEDGQLNFWTMNAGTLTEVLHLDSTSLHPETTDGVSLGTSALNFSDLFLDSGGVINFDGGDVTLTHSAAKLTWGGDGAVEIDFNNHEMTNVDINSGAIDGTTIGAASAAAGTFAALVSTTFTPSGAIDVQGGYANGGGAPYDGVVDAGGGGNWTTAQEGDNALGDAGDYTMLIKGGAYSTLTVATDDAYIFVEPGATFSGAIVLDGDNITLVTAGNVAISGTVTLSGANCVFLAQGKTTTAGLVMTGAGCFHDGGGEGTVHDGGTANDGIDMGDGNRVQNCTANTDGGGGQAFVAVDAADAHNGWLVNVRVTDSDGVGVLISGNDFYMSGVDVRAADGAGIQTTAVRTRLIGNYVRSGVAGVGLDVTGTGDGMTGTGNIINAAGGAGTIDTDAENCAWMANKSDGAITDNSGTSTVAPNHETGF